MNKTSVLIGNFSIEKIKEYAEGSSAMINCKINDNILLKLNTLIEMISQDKNSKIYEIIISINELIKYDYDFLSFFINELLISNPEKYFSLKLTKERVIK